MGQLNFDGNQDQPNRKTRETLLRELLLELMTNNEARDVDCDAAVDEAVRRGIFKWDETPALARKAMRADMERILRGLHDKGGAPVAIPRDGAPFQYVLVPHAKQKERRRNIIRRGLQVFGSYDRWHKSHQQMKAIDGEEETPQIAEFKDGWTIVRGRYRAEAVADENAENGESDEEEEQ